MAAMGNEYTPNKTLRLLRAGARSVLSTIEPQCLAQCLVHKWCKMNFCRVKVTKPEQVGKREARGQSQDRGDLFGPMEKPSSKRVRDRTRLFLPDLTFRC